MQARKLRGRLKVYCALGLSWLQWLRSEGGWGGRASTQAGRSIINQVVRINTCRFAPNWRGADEWTGLLKLMGGGGDWP